jgi:hypothetical protein
MNSQILRSKIKEQVENKINPILKEKYQENIALKLFRASIEIIRESVDRITEMYYIYYPQQEKEDFVKEVELHVFEWKTKVQERSDEEDITGLDHLLSSKIIDTLEEYLEALEESDIDKRQYKLYYVDSFAAVWNNRRIEDIIKHPYSVELCRRNNWVAEMPKNN